MAKHSPLLKKPNREKSQVVMESNASLITHNTKMDALLRMMQGNLEMMAEHKKEMNFRMSKLERLLQEVTSPAAAGAEKKVQSAGGSLSTAKSGSAAPPHEDLGRYRIWLHFLCMLILNMNVIRTDRHGSPVAVLQTQHKDKKQGDYVIVVYSPFIRSHMAYLLPIFETKTKIKLNRVSDQWSHFMRQFSNSGIFQKGKRCLTFEQQQHLYKLWGVNPDMKLAHFRKRILAIRGHELEACLAKAVKTQEFAVMKKFWLGQVEPRTKILENKVRALDSSVFPVQMDNCIVNRISFLISRDEMNQVIQFGFSGLSLLLSSPTLNSIDGKIQHLPWKERAIRGGWVCDMFHDKDKCGWPTWMDVVKQESQTVGNLHPKDFYMTYLWWHDKNPLPSLQEYLNELKKKARFVATKKVSQVNDDDDVNEPSRKRIKMESSKENGGNDDDENEDEENQPIKQEDIPDTPTGGAEEEEEEAESGEDSGDEESRAGMVAVSP